MVLKFNMLRTQNTSLLRSEIFHNNLLLRDLTLVPSFSRAPAPRGGGRNSWSEPSTPGTHSFHAASSINNLGSKLIPQAHKRLTIEDANLIAFLLSTREIILHLGEGVGGALWDLQDSWTAWNTCPSLYLEGQHASRWHSGSVGISENAEGGSTQHGATMVATMLP